MCKTKKKGMNEMTLKNAKKKCQKNGWEVKKSDFNNHCYFATKEGKRNRISFHKNGDSERIGCISLSTADGQDYGSPTFCPNLSMAIRIAESSFVPSHSREWAA